MVPKLHVKLIILFRITVNGWELSESDYHKQFHNLTGHSSPTAAAFNLVATCLCAISYHRLIEATIAAERSCNTSLLKQTLESLDLDGINTGAKFFFQILNRTIRPCRVCLTTFSGYPGSTCSRKECICFMIDKYCTTKIIT